MLTAMRVISGPCIPLGFLSQCKACAVVKLEQGGRALMAWEGEICL